MTDAGTSKTNVTPDSVKQFVLTAINKQIQSGDSLTVVGDSKMNDLGMDSLDQVEVVMAIETEYGITISEDEAQSFMSPNKTIDDMIEHVINRVTTQMSN